MPSDEEILIERMREWLDYQEEGVHPPSPPPGSAAAGYKLTPVPVMHINPEDHRRLVGSHPEFGAGYEIKSPSGSPTQPPPVQKPKTWRDLPPLL